MGPIGAKRVSLALNPAVLHFELVGFRVSINYATDCDFPCRCPGIAMRRTS